MAGGEAESARIIMAEPIRTSRDRLSTTDWQTFTVSVSLQGQFSVEYEKVCRWEKSGGLRRRLAASSRLSVQPKPPDSSTLSIS